MNTQQTRFGIGDNSYKAAGELPGLIALVDEFYDFMQALPEAKNIRDMHSTDLTESRRKLAYFLSGWLGGPKLYKEHFGSISIPPAHRHLNVGQTERDAWIMCMQKAVELQPFSKTFKIYLIEQLMVPAERIRVACTANKKT